MKKVVFLVSIVFLVSCGSAKQVFTAKKDGRGNLLGTASKEMFQQNYSWFNNSYNNYTPNADVIKKIKPLLKKVKIKAFMATWCGDSKRETPPFYKVLDAAGFKYKNLEMVTVDYSKRYNGMEKTYNIYRVPTFVFFKKDKELGRLIERRGARQSLEQDILNILSK